MVILIDCFVHSAYTRPPERVRYCSRHWRKQWTRWKHQVSPAISYSRDKRSRGHTESNSPPFTCSSPVFHHSMAPSPRLLQESSATSWRWEANTWWEWPPKASKRRPVAWVIIVNIEKWYLFRAQISPPYSYCLQVELPVLQREQTKLYIIWGWQ